MMAERRTNGFEGSDDPLASEGIPQRIYKGNTFDIAAFVALVMGVVTLLICGTMGYLMYCLPVFPLVLGIAGLATAQKSVDPKRSRLLSWIGLGTGGITLLLALVLFVVWIVLMLFFITLPLMIEGRY
jgi:hypothetical protein